MTQNSTAERPTPKRIKTVDAAFLIRPPMRRGRIRSKMLCSMVKSPASMAKADHLQGSAVPMGDYCSSITNPPVQIRTLRSSRNAIRFCSTVLIFPTRRAVPFDSSFPHRRTWTVLALTALMASLSAARDVNTTAFFGRAGIIQSRDLVANVFGFFSIGHERSLTSIQNDAKCILDRAAQNWFAQSWIKG
jgi:hypothetical protein